VLRKPSGFLTPESSRPDLRLAPRGVLGLMVPILLARALELPELNLVGIAAFLLTWATLRDRRRPDS
jgi:hypothetical protein